MVDVDKNMDRHLANLRIEGDAAPVISYPVVNIQKALEKGPFIVDLPFKNGDFP